ncbi:MAG: energy transducer TonB, partial [Nitrospinota bacterium]
IIESVHNSWNLPGNLPGRERMVAVVTFRVLRDGSIRDIRVERSSGNIHFDNSALRAVEKIDPLPPFPAELGRDVLDIGVRFHNPEA